MAFPTTPILDDFNTGASQALTARSGWAALAFFAGETTLTTDSAPTYAEATTPGTYYSNYRSDLTGDDCETWVTLAATGADFYLYARIDQTSGNGYYFSAVGGNITLNKMAGFVGAGVIATIAQGVGIGDSAGISCVESTITAWYKPSAGSWSSVLQVTDTTYPGGGAGASYTAFEAQGLSRFTEFGGGAAAGIRAPARDTHTAIPFTQGAGGGGLRGGPH